MQKHLPWKELGWALLFLAVVSTAYFGAYFWLVVPSISGGTGWNSIEPAYSNPFLHRSCAGMDWAVTFFVPAHQVDKLLRPSRWPEPVFVAAP